MNNQRKFEKAQRRKMSLMARRRISQQEAIQNPSARHIKKMSAHYKFLGAFERMRKRGIRLGDGTLATVENRWVRKALRADPSLQAS
jgi:ribosomal 50S subunit-associated protein YjgA (DUF615 family)